ncbi:hypothetical protein, partial [Aeromonas veronii]|uniref:hypothetical protein n=1 Tax=Aeromonas veronii TaxID=654 RepID=UPI003D1A7054
YHQSAVGHLSPFIHECRTYYLNSRFKQDIATDPRSELATNYDELTTPQQDNKRIPIPEHVEPEQKKRGFLSRFFLPYG